MKRSLIAVCIMMLCWYLIGQVCYAERAYVTDSFEITFRTGPGIDHKIIAVLRSGEPLEILKSLDRWTRVRLEKPRQGETEGWVMTRYLMTRRPCSTEVKFLKEENERLNKKLTDINTKWAASARREKDLDKRLKENEVVLQTLRDDYENLKHESADFLKLKMEYESTQSKLQDCQKRLESMTRKNEDLMNSQKHKWFGIGALVLLAGLVIGLYFGRQQKKRRPSLYY
jgi:SH3 domain protein